MNRVAIALRHTIHKKPKIYLVYCSYPYTENPKQCSEEIKLWAQKMLNKHSDLVLLVPHFVFDAIYDFPKNFDEIVKKHGKTNISSLPIWELTLIEYCHIFAYNPMRMSAGVIWEKAFAEKMGIPIITMKELEDGKRPE